MLARFDRLRSVITDCRLAAALALGVGLWAAPAAAHIALLTPMARYPMEHQKNEPCGHPENPPGAGPVATYQAGETITLEFEEFVDHPGHYRVSLDPTGTDSFTNPTAFDDFYNSPEVILDDIPDANGMYSIEVTLPDTPCDPCTLQLMQVMEDGMFGPGTSDLYFQCADIVIEGASAETADPTTGAESSGGGQDSSGGGAGSGGGDVGSGEAGSSEGSSSGSDTGGSDTSAASVTPDATGPGGADDDSGCSCRAAAGSTGAAPWLLVALMAWRRRRG